MKWNEKLSNIFRTIGVIPYMFIVFAPSLILTVFNIYFNLSIFETVAVALGLSYQYYQKLKWFVYLSSILLIMRPLIEQLFSQTGNSINSTEKAYLDMMKYVGIGIIGVGGIAYAMAYLIGEINVNEYKQIANPTWYQSMFGLNMEIVGKRPINLYEAGIDIASMFASYFTETLAGFMLITSKDILFPTKTPTVSPNQAVNDKKDMDLKRKFDELYSTVEHLNIHSENDYNTVNGKVGNLQSYPNQFTNEELRKETSNKIKSLKDKLKSWRDENPK